nr:hydrogenase maturation protease [Armatimonadota bacterium]
MSGALVIGYGNPLRRDDGLGPMAAQRLAALADPLRVQVLTPYQLSPELAEPISQARFVLFIDASEEGVPG